MLIFAEKKADVDDIHEYLLLKGVEAVAIHGDKGIIVKHLHSLKPCFVGALRTQVTEDPGKEFARFLQCNNLSHCVFHSIIMIMILTNLYRMKSRRALYEVSDCLYPKS